MLDAEARMLLDLMEKAVQDGRPKLNTLPYAVGRQAVDKMSEDSEADPPQVGETIDGDFAGPGGKIRFRRYRPRLCENALSTLRRGKVIGGLWSLDFGGRPF